VSENGNGAHRPASLTLVPKATEHQSLKDFKSDQEVRWCPGCGDYAILAAFQAFLPELDVPRENVVVATKVFSETGTKSVNSRGMSHLHIMDAVKASLKRLQLDHIDLYQIQLRSGNPDRRGRARTR